MNEILRLDKEFFPKRFSWKSRLKLKNHSYYLSKRTPNGNQAKTINAYLMPSGILIYGCLDKVELVAYLIDKDSNIDEKLKQRGVINEQLYR